MSKARSYTPDRIVSNREIEGMVPTSDEWIYENLGIGERRIADRNQATSDLASQAAIQAIESAGVDAHDIDLIIQSVILENVSGPITRTFLYVPAATN